MPDKSEAGAGKSKATYLASQL